MSRYRIIPASKLQPGLATIVVSLPDRTIRSRAVMVQHRPSGIVQVAFECGDILNLSPRSAIGCIDPEKPRRRASVA